MNKEIRDILFELQFLGNKEIQSKFVKLCDYITNLQQEVDKLTAESTEWESKCYGLQEERDWWQDRFFGQQEYDDSHRITAIEYKKRIDKVINDINRYIDARKTIDKNTKYYYTNEFYKKPIKSNIAYLFNDYLEYLLNILQNESENQ